MAEEPEKGMLFDLRGRRKRVIQVIYVILAVIMAASLVVIGLPGGLNLFNSGSSVVSQDAADLAKERAVKIQAKLAKEPGKTNLQADLIRERIVAGNSLVQVDDAGKQTVGPEAQTQYELAAEEWDVYLKKTGNRPDRGVAQLVSGMLFSLAQGGTVAQFQANVAAAARAQRFVVDDALVEFRTQDGPVPIGPLVTLAAYEYYALDFGAAKAAGQQALALAESKSVREDIQRQLDSFEKDAKAVKKQIEQARKQARKDKGKSLESPFGSLGAQQGQQGLPSTGLPTQP